MQAAMTSTTVTVSRKGHLVGAIMSGFVVLFLLLDAVIHILRIPPVVEAFAQLKYPVSASVPFGVIELVCLALYLLPRTSVLGAVLLTGYLGGAVAIHVGAGSPLFSHALFPVYTGLLLWGGLYLRNERLRALVTGRA